MMAEGFRVCAADLRPLDDADAAGLEGPGEADGEGGRLDGCAMGGEGGP